MVDNLGETDYQTKIQSVARTLEDHHGPIVVVGHVDPDGDALGSTLTLKRALETLGKDVTLPMEPPHFLSFLVGTDELSPALESLPEDTLLAVLDVAEMSRIEGAPADGAVTVVNIDHHGTNERFGDVSLVEPGKAATAQIVKDVVEALGIAWTSELATPCLTGILTDTGMFRYGNTDPAVLAAAADLIAASVSYAELTDRLQWRPPGYFEMLGRVMDTVSFPCGGLAVTAEVTEAMRRDLGDLAKESDDFVGTIRYAEGTYVAVLFKESGDAVKVSVRTREPASAQAICLELGGGGHVAAAGAKVAGPLVEAKKVVLEAVARELKAKGFEVPEAAPVS